MAEPSSLLFLYAFTLASSWFWITLAWTSWSFGNCFDRNVMIANLWSWMWAPLTQFIIAFRCLRKVYLLHFIFSDWNCLTVLILCSWRVQFHLMESFRNLELVFSVENSFENYKCCPGASFILILLNNGILYTMKLVRAWFKEVKTLTLGSLCIFSCWRSTQEP